MSDFRVGYLYSFAPLHPGGEGDLGNILDIVREVHTHFPYLPGSSLRGSLRCQVKDNFGEEIANRLFGQELKPGSTQMGVHKVWFGDARLLWVPMRTMALSNSPNKQAFTWISCPSLLRDHALLSRQKVPSLPNHPVGNRTGEYWVADSKITVQQVLTTDQTEAIKPSTWAPTLSEAVANAWQSSHMILPDNDFEILMEHSLWTQIRNKITDDSEDNTEGGSAEVFWTDICIPRDTILYFPWGYRNGKDLQPTDHDSLMQIVQGLFQVGGQANVGRGWVQGWVNNSNAPAQASSPQEEQLQTVEV